MWRALALVRLDGLVRERGGLDFVLNEDAADISRRAEAAAGAGRQPHRPQADLHF